MDAPEDPPEDPPIIEIPSDDEDDDMEPEPEPEPCTDPDLELGHTGWLKAEEEEFGEDPGAEEDFEEDLEEILFDDGDWDVDSDASSMITIEHID